MKLRFSASENCLEIRFGLIVTEISEAISFKRMNTPLNPLLRQAQDAVSRGDSN